MKKQYHGMPEYRLHEVEKSSTFFYETTELGCWEDMSDIGLD